MSKRILVVDDEEILLKTFSRLLGKFGYASRAVGSGREALKAAETSIFDLVLCDILMPNMDGFETIHRLREMSVNAQRCKPAFVVMTGKVTQEMESKVDRLSADAVLWKPFGAHDFLYCVNQILEEPRIDFGMAAPISLQTSALGLRNAG